MQNNHDSIAFMCNVIKSLKKTSDVNKNSLPWSRVKILRRMMK